MRPKPTTRACAQCRQLGSPSSIFFWPWFYRNFTGWRMAERRYTGLVAERDCIRSLVTLREKMLVACGAIKP